MSEKLEPVRVAPRVVHDIIAHARDHAPDECCGLLVGPAPPGGARMASSIDEAVPTTNLERGPARYRVDPAQHVALQKRLRGTGRVIAGAYHSHPHTDAVPSPSDISEALYPDFVYLIVSLAQPHSPVVRAWRIRDGTAVELELLQGRSESDP